MFGKWVGKNKFLAQKIPPMIFVVELGSSR
jgi:hypothetical protein